MFDKPRPDDDPLDRDPAEVLREAARGSCPRGVERREIDVAALGLDHVIAVGLAKQRGDAEPGARADDR